jgi:NACHT domain
LTDAGKTILASVIIQDCLEATGTTCAYFYCKHADPHRNTFLSIARTLLAQLLKQHPDLLPHFYDQLLSSGQSSLTSPKLCQELLQVALQHGRRTHVIIDGLDECPTTERRTVLSWFISAIETCNKQDPGRLRILFVSQDEPDIRKLLQTSSIIRLTADDMGNDIALFVRRWAADIQEKFDIADCDVSVMENSICEKAEGTATRSRSLTIQTYIQTGMFLYAKLVVTNLFAQPSQAQLREEIGPNRFPKGLEQA